MPARINITGLRSHHWTAIKPAENVLYGGRVVTAWACRCDCGQERVLPTEHFKKGAFYSCGCFNQELWRLGKIRVQEKKQCSVEGCPNLYASKGFCLEHYDQWKRYGDPLVRLRARKGSGYTTPSGYRLINGKSEHRCVMESILDRKLIRGESVHHINGDRSDNRPGNLELWSNYQPSGQRVQDKIRYAEELVVTYNHLFGSNLPQTGLANLPKYKPTSVKDESGYTLKVNPDGFCAMSICSRPTHAQGFCRKHYSKLVLAGILTVRVKRVCEMPGCNGTYQAKGMCCYHYNQSRSGGIKPRQDRRAKGTGTLHVDGYWLVTVGGKQVLEHRVVMEAIIGRPLLKHESVHHKNGDRLDNHPDNLELWSKSQPTGQRVLDKLAWAFYFLDQYKNHQH